MITERLMKPGSFSVRLREDYPFSVYRAPLDGGTPVLLAEVADRPSASTAPC